MWELMNVETKDYFYLFSIASGKGNEMTVRLLARIS